MLKVESKGNKMEEIIEKIEQNIQKVQKEIYSVLSTITSKKEFYALQSQYLGRSILYRFK